MDRVRSFLGVLSPENKRVLSVLVSTEKISSVAWKCLVGVAACSSLLLFRFPLAGAITVITAGVGGVISYDIASGSRYIKQEIESGRVEFSTFVKPFKVESPSSTALLAVAIEIEKIKRGRASLTLLGRTLLDLVGEATQGLFKIWSGALEKGTGASLLLQREIGNLDRIREGLSHESRAIEKFAHLTLLFWSVIGFLSVVSFTSQSAWPALLLALGMLVKEGLSKEKNPWMLLSALVFQAAIFYPATAAYVRGITSLSLLSVSIVGALLSYDLLQFGKNLGMVVEDTIFKDITALFSGTGISGLYAWTRRTFNYEETRTDLIAFHALVNDSEKALCRGMSPLGKYLYRTAK